MSNLTKQEPEDYFQYEGDCFGHEQAQCPTFNVPKRENTKSVIIYSK